jgi:tetratricopeptide (TPR) repeat protein
MERLGSESERYLRYVVGGLPIWVRGELQAELRDHLRDGSQRRIDAGSDPSTAEAEALAALGPADDLQRELLRVHRRHPWLGWLADAVAVVVSRLSFGPLGWLAATHRFSRDYKLGRYDAIIVRGEHELRVRGPRYHLHDELGLAYNAIREYDRALDNFRAGVAWQRQHPMPRYFGPAAALATTYGNLAGVLEAVGRREESEAATREGLALDSSHPMLHLQRSRQLAARGDATGALRHLEAAFNGRAPRGFDKAILMFAQDPGYSAVRDDPRFQRLLLRAAAS